VVPDSALADFAANRLEFPTSNNPGLLSNFSKKKRFGPSSPNYDTLQKLLDESEQCEQFCHSSVENPTTETESLQKFLPETLLQKLAFGGGGCPRNSPAKSQSPGLPPLHGATSEQ
jgi:hypothetical protein